MSHVGLCLTWIPVLSIILSNHCNISCPDDPEEFWKIICLGLNINDPLGTVSGDANRSDLCFLGKVCVFPKQNGVLFIFESDCRKTYFFQTDIIDLWLISKPFLFFLEACILTGLLSKYPYQVFKKKGNKKNNQSPLVGCKFSSSPPPARASLPAFACVLYRFHSSYTCVFFKISPCTLVGSMSAVSFQAHKAWFSSHNGINCEELHLKSMEVKKCKMGWEKSPASGFYF